MDLSIFLVLPLVTLQFIGEYFSWNETKVKLAIFVFALAVSLPNIVFMFIDWWQSPHSKIALLVLNTFRPILRGEISRLFRWLKRVGINLACDELNHLPITKTSSESFEFYMTRECSIQTETRDNLHVCWIGGRFDEAVGEYDLRIRYCWHTKFTLCTAAYIDGVLHVHQLDFSRKLLARFCELSYGLVGHPLFRSKLTNSASYHVDASRAKLLLSRLTRIYALEIPILTQFERRREWLYFHAGSILDNLDGDLVLVKSQGEFIAVGSPCFTIFKCLGEVIKSQGPRKNLEDSPGEWDILDAMDLSIFLILLFVTFQFIGEYFNWNQTKVKLAIFVFALAVSLPNIVFMFIDWWQSPHSKVALLVLNTFRPILRGEVPRLFRWLKRVGINLACDELNHLPITKTSTDSFEFYMTRECSIQTETRDNVHVNWNGGRYDEEVVGWDLAQTTAYFTKFTFCVSEYIDGVLHVHQLDNRRKLLALYYELGLDVVDHPLFKSSFTKSASYHVDPSRAKLLMSRLERIYVLEIPILTQFERKREWFYFHAGSILDNLNGDLVLIKTQGLLIAVGSPRFNIFK